MRKKRFLPVFFTGLVFWGAFLYLIFFLPPENNFLIFTFHFSLFWALFFSLALLFRNTRRGFLLATAIIIFLALRFLKQSHPLNLILLGGIILTLEIYFSRQ